MIDQIITNNLADFGSRELKMAAELLTAYHEKNDTELLGDKIQIYMNRNSGCVFLSDEDCNVAMINSDTGQLEDWLTCPECGEEGFAADIKENVGNVYKECCLEYVEGLG